MFGIGIEELIVILLILLLLTGGKKLPELTRGLGQSIREIRKGFMEEIEPEDETKTTKAKRAKNTAPNKNKKTDLS